VKSTSFDKLNWQKWLLVNFKINRLPDVHIVQRYLAAGAALGIKDDGQGLDYFIPENQEIALNTLPTAFQAGYVAVAIGAQHATKRLPPEKLVELCQRLAPRPILLLGGPEDAPAAEAIIKIITETHSPIHPFAHSPIENGCGRYSLHQSASLVRQAQFVVSHDTGLMHIAAAFGKPIFSVWGNTVPEFGMYPFRTEHQNLEVKGLNCRPCSKIGFAKCPQGHFKCMREQVLDLDWPAIPVTR
jgi:ADP-heptose:LPS heptosyltransferase